MNVSSLFKNPTLHPRFSASAETKTISFPQTKAEIENDLSQKEQSIQRGLQQWFPESWQRASLSTPLFRFLAHPFKTGGVYGTVSGLGAFLLSKTFIGDEMVRSMRPQLDRNTSVSNSMSMDSVEASLLSWLF